MSPTNNTLPVTPQPDVIAAVTPTAHPQHRAPRVVIRGYPKITVYLPTMVAALIAGLFMRFHRGDVAGAETVGLSFLIVFALNTLIVAFEFPRMTAVAVMLLLACFGLLLALLNQMFAVFASIAHFFGGLHLLANANFYFAIAAVLSIVLAIAWIITRFDYWVVMNNELLHRHGPFGSMERYPAPQLKLDKQIPDVFEYLIFRSGRLVFHPTSERQALIVENVMGINRVEKKIKHLLEALEVRIEQD